MVPIINHIYAALKHIIDKTFAKFLKNSAVLFKSIGGRNNLLKAQSILLRAIKINETFYGVDSPEVNDFQSNYAIVLRHLGGNENLNLAESILRKTIKIGIVKLGKDSPQVASYYSNLGGVLYDIGGRNNLIEAFNILQIALKTDMNTSPINVLKVAKRNSNLSSICHHLGGEYLTLAKDFGEKCLKLYKDFHGDVSVDVVNSKGNLALLLIHIGGKANFETALIYAVEAKDASIRISGEFSYLTSQMQYVLASVLKHVKGCNYLNEAKEAIEISLRWSKEHLVDDSVLLCKRLFLLAEILYELGGLSNLKEAEKLIEVIKKNVHKSNSLLEKINVLNRSILFKLDKLSGY